jgi:hypothetical protein
MKLVCISLRFCLKASSACSAPGFSIYCCWVGPSQDLLFAWCLLLGSALLCFPVAFWLIAA